MHSGFAVPLGLVGAQCLAAALFAHDRVADVLTTFWALFQ